MYLDGALIRPNDLEFDRGRGRIPTLDRDDQHRPARLPAGLGARRLIPDIAALATNSVTERDTARGARVRPSHHGVARGAQPGHPLQRTAPLGPHHAPPRLGRWRGETPSEERLTGPLGNCR